jgi:hypothetical protein
MKRFHAILFALLAILGISSAFAQAAAPDIPVLAITGKAGPRVFALADLEALPQAEFAAIDPWSGKEHSYSGPLFSDILKKAGIAKDAVSVTVKAANDYQASVRMDDLRKYRYIIAIKLDGAVMAGKPELRKYGAFMVAIDFKRSPELDAEIYKNQLVWQVVEIEAR